MPDLKFASLLSSRICHDLISPVGAINNGLEILAEVSDGEMKDEAMRLIRSSAANASAKLQFMRLAFGAGGNVTEAMSLDEARSLTEGLVANAPIELSWHASTPSLDKTVLRLLLNMVLIGFDALPRGGTLQVGVRREGATNLMIAAEGDKVRIPASSLEVLRSGASLEALEPKKANMLLTHTLAAQLDTVVHATVTDQRAELAATF